MKHPIHALLTCLFSNDLGASIIRVEDLGATVMGASIYSGTPVVRVEVASQSAADAVAIACFCGEFAYEKDLGGRFDQTVDSLPALVQSKGHAASRAPTRIGSRLKR